MEATVSKPSVWAKANAVSFLEIQPGFCKSTKNCSLNSLIVLLYSTRTNTVTLVTRYCKKYSKSKILIQHVDG